MPTEIPIRTDFATRTAKAIHKALPPSHRDISFAERDLFLRISLRYMKRLAQRIVQLGIPIREEDMIRSWAEELALTQSLKQTFRNLLAEIEEQAGEEATSGHVM